MLSDGKKLGFPVLLPDSRLGPWVYLFHLQSLKKPELRKNAQILKLVPKGQDL